ncbi:MAG TPA: DUF6249 domain-containing protein [Chryseosolibacter sp.]|nr:DUF6249 domain-containing protein [Chryseosolibacter sp.]
MMKNICCTVLLSLATSIVFAQDKNITTTDALEMGRAKIVPDKVYEIGIPLLFIFIVLNTLVHYLKNRAEHQLKMKMIEKGISEESLIKIFQESNAITRLQPLKWFMFSLATGLALTTVYVVGMLYPDSSGYIPTAIILLFISGAFLAYHRILSKHN